MTSTDDEKQIKEHIRTLEYVFDELSMQYVELTDRINRLADMINKEKDKLKESK